MTCFALYATPSDITSGMHDTYVCVHGVHALKLAHLSIQVAWHACKPTQT